MAKRMLIDATHPEETRVVVVNGNRLEEFDFESSTKKQVKGNIYLAKITRVEPSLQAAFVEYGGNRHGFLAFSEIHPDYYRIPVADRGEDSGDPQPREPLAPDGTNAAAGEGGTVIAGIPLEPVVVEIAPSRDDIAAAVPPAVPDPLREVELVEGEAGIPEARLQPSGLPWEEGPFAARTAPEPVAAFPEPEASLPGLSLEPAALSVSQSRPDWADERAAEPDPLERDPWTEPQLPFSDAEAGGPRSDAGSEWAAAASGDEIILAPDNLSAEYGETAPQLEPGAAVNGDGDAEIVETLGGDEFEDAEHQRSRVHRHYKIQEVVKRRQIMLVQVTKEERGNKGAALTTYLSLAGRYCVLMPNTARGGGVSRKITSLSDRRRLKDILEDLDIPEGMGVIVRTAGGERSKAEIKRDYEYLLRLWNEIRELTLRSTAPALIYEEGDLIKRSIRDLYTRDLDEVLVEGEDGYRTAKAFMKMLMPSHAKRVQPYRDPQIGLLHRFQVESQIDAIHSPLVQLRSGGYIVIDQTEALVAIDVNSGRATRERNIEETALRTNLEAAEEIARQLRLRDLAGLIVIDFIDMEEHRNQGAVERRLKDALKSDRARIQVGRISPFGLMEMSRQRLRPSLVEASTQPCPHCGGTGFIRSTESTALHVLRSIEEEGMRRRSAEICVYVPTTVALYILNHKRDSLAQLETRYGIHVLVARDDALIPPAFRLERLRAWEPGETENAVPVPLTQTPDPEESDAEDEAEEAAEAADAEPEGEESDDERVRARRRRRRRRRHDDERSRIHSPADAEQGEAAAEEAAVQSAAGETDAEPEGEEDGENGRLRRRRGRRGGRRRSRREEGSGSDLDIARPAAETVEIVAADAGHLDGDAPEFRTAEPGVAEEEGAPPALPVFEPALAAIAIETASLPALAGDIEVRDHIASATSWATPAPEIAVATGEPQTNPPPGDGAPGNGWDARPVPLHPAPGLGSVERGYEPATTVTEVAIAAIPEPPEPAPEPATTVTEIAIAAAPEPPAPEPEPEPAATVTKVEIAAIPESAPEPEPAAPAAPVTEVEIAVAAEPEPAPEPEPAAATPPEPEPAATVTPHEPAPLTQVVQEVTAKPENPRRGWWQRLIQS